MERFLTFSINNFNGTSINSRFIESYKHLAYPLDCLVNYLFNKDTNIQSIKTKFSSFFQHFNDKAVKLRKGIYPYDYIDEDWENKLKQKEIPDIKYFHSSLNNAKCSVDDYNYAKEIYNYFGCEEISHYNDLSVKTDVLLFFADVFSAYRKKMHRIYGLDTLYCISTPGFTNRAILKMTSIEVKLITDVNKHIMVENGIGAGRCEPIYYHAKANNKHVNQNFSNEK